VRRAAIAALFSGVLVAGCTSAPDAFLCQSSAQCRLDTMAGVCELSGLCSFPDPACATSGRRYGRYAGSMAGTCVVESLSSVDGGDDGAVPPADGAVPHDGGAPDGDSPATDGAANDGGNDLSAGGTPDLTGGPVDMAQDGGCKCAPLICSAGLCL